MDITFRNHPAQARHPVTRAPLFDGEGSPVPLILDQRAIYLDGVMVGYCGTTPNSPINLIFDHRKLGEAVRAEIKAAVEAKFGAVTNVCLPPRADLVQAYLSGEADGEVDYD